MRKWMRNHGKAHMLDFTEEQVIKLRKFFDALDVDGGGTITIDEVMIPLIGLGLANTVREVKAMFMFEDEDGSGEIEFDEFLCIISKDKKYGSDSSGRSAIKDFFMDLTNGQYKTEGKPFINWVLKE